MPASRTRAGRRRTGTPSARTACRGTGRAARRDVNRLMTRPPTSRSRRARTSVGCRCAGGCRPPRPNRPRPGPEAADDLAGRYDEVGVGERDASAAWPRASPPAPRRPCPGSAVEDAAPGRRRPPGPRAAVSSVEPSSTTTTSRPPSAASVGQLARGPGRRSPRSRRLLTIGRDHHRQPHLTRRRGPPERRSELLAADRREHRGPEDEDAHHERRGGHTETLARGAATAPTSHPLVDQRQERDARRPPRRPAPCATYGTWFRYQRSDGLGREGDVAGGPTRRRPRW